MGRTRIAVIGTLLGALLLAAPAGALWDPARRIANPVLDAEEPDVAAAGGHVHAVWQGDIGGNLEIFYRHSGDEGASWDSRARISKTSGVSWMPEVAATTDRVHVIWLDETPGNREVYVRSGHLQEGIWFAKRRLTITSNNEWSADIAASGDVVHAVWHEELSSGGIRIIYRRSNNGGLTWQRPVRLSKLGTHARTPAVAVDGSTVHVAWVRLDGTNANVYYRRSIDCGITWQPMRRISGMQGTAGFPAIAADAGRVHVVWDENPQGVLDAFYRGSPDGGVNWDPRQRIVQTPRPTQITDVAASGATVWAFVETQGAHTSTIRATISTDGGGDWTPHERVDSSRGAQRPSVAATSTAVHAVWQQWTTGGDHYVMYMSGEGPVGR